MSNANNAWNLPPDFAPVRYPVSDEIKNIVRPMLGANEPVIVSLTNDEDAITLIGTPNRLLTIKTGGLSAGAAGLSVREFPWEGLTDIVTTVLGLQMKIALHFRSSNGRTVEVGRRAQLGKPAIENVAGFDAEMGNAACAALIQIWKHKSGAGTEDLLG